MITRRERSSPLFYALSVLLVVGCGTCAKSPAPRAKSRTWAGAGLRPETALKSGVTGEPLIRVLLMDGVNELAVAIPGPYQVRGGDTILAQGPNLHKIRITLVKGTPPRVMIGQLACPPGTVEIVPSTPGTLRLYFTRPGRQEFSRRYQGYARITARPNSGRGGTNLIGNATAIDVVNLIPLEDYLPSVLQAELYPNWHLETYRVQAIAARTYALYQMRTANRELGYDVRATEASQVYKGIEGLPDNLHARRAARETRGIVCTWASPRGEKIFPTYYSSACGGMTQDVANCFNDPSIPPLAGRVKCTYCKIGGRVYRWEPVRMSKSAVTQLFVKRFPEHAQLDSIQTIDVVNTTADGRPLTLRLRGANGHNATVDSYAFRLAMGGHRVLSNHCRIADLGSEFEFRNGRGFGHSVGMCQWGAEGQARLGTRASEILRFYYPQSHLKRAY